MKLIKTKKVNYYINSDKKFCFDIDTFNGQKTYKFNTLSQLKFNSDTLYQLNSKRKIN